MIETKDDVALLSKTTAWLVVLTAEVRFAYYIVAFAYAWVMSF